jgi:diaminohydroxyphosphoribosylaminopyrimidine deaminase / 5-amino-6-(5-phosphoribosylamino)uracil reductase
MAHMLHTSLLVPRLTKVAPGIPNDRNGATSPRSSFYGAVAIEDRIAVLGRVSFADHENAATASGELRHIASRSRSPARFLRQDDTRDLFFGASVTDRLCGPSPNGWDLAHAACLALRTCDEGLADEIRLSAQGGHLEVARDRAANDEDYVLSWCASTGWKSNLPLGDARRTLLDLYLPITGVRPDHAITIGHLGQSLDGFIATLSGDSFYVTGSENILHLHRLRALCDAVVVGAMTVQEDNPQLTTRLVQGRNPVRVILDPQGRLPPTLRVFSDAAAPTLRVCARGAAGAAQARSRGEDVLEVTTNGGRIDLQELVTQLHARGCRRVLVEGGGVTVSSFLEAGLLDRLHVAVAPLLIGDGRPAIRLAARQRLKDCLTVQPRIYRTGLDILYDCDLRVSTLRSAKEDSGGVHRII